MEEFLKIFGNFTIADVVTLVIALIFLYGAYCKLKVHFNKQYKNNEQINEILQRYSEWHQQSINAQKQFADTIAELKKGQKENSEKLEKMDIDNKKREQNRLRERLLQSYRYYTSVDKNPMQEWSEMEADAFWKLFEDYEDVGGDGYMHTIVQPSMRTLDVIQMHETERITELMKSRK